VPSGALLLPTGTKVLYLERTPVDLSNDCESVSSTISSIVGLIGLGGLEGGSAGAEELAEEDTPRVLRKDPNVSTESSTNPLLVLELRVLSCVELSFFFR
jgi:hypothetical protein